MSAYDPKLPLNAPSLKRYDVWALGAAGVRRREFITFIGGAAAIWPSMARAQQPSVPVIGFLNSASPTQEPNRRDAFRKGLTEVGYVEGRNVTVEYRWAENRLDRLAELANDLVHRQVTVIAAGYNVAAVLAAKTASKTIPIIFTTGVDPVEAGLVASLNRPGGNLTGVTNLSNQVVPKHLELIRELVPAAKNVALFVNPTNPAAETISRDARGAAQKSASKCMFCMSAPTVILRRRLKNCANSEPMRL